MNKDRVADVVYNHDHTLKSVSIDGEPLRDVLDIDIRYDSSMYGYRYEIRVILHNGVYKVPVDRLNYTVLTEEAEKAMIKETVKVTVKRSEPSPPPVESVTIELAPDQASMLRYFFGRLSPAKVRTSVELGPAGDYVPEAIHRLTSSIYGILLEEGL